MGLNDLMSEIKQDPASFIGDEPTETKVLKQVLSLVEDRISEVKNQAVKWYGPHLLYLALRTYDFNLVLCI
jgi:cullin-associated NEDD8-dissociated protein 1